MMSPAGQSNRILLVEDEALFTMHMEQVLGDAGFQIVGEAREGKQAVQMAGATGPDLVLMDVNLCGQMDGVAAATEIWNRFGIPSLFMTANPAVTRTARAAKAHSLGVIEKPVDGRAVVKTITELLGDDTRSEGC